ncbi:MAG: cyclase family protein [Candidatus Bathyarchaeia archaeon]
MRLKKIIDLSHTMYHSMPAWPTSPNFLYEMTGHAARDRSTMHIIRQMTTHTGTHVDTPLHFVVGGKSVDQLPIEAFVGEGIVIDISHKKAGEEIRANDLKPYADQIRPDDVLMLYTGWGEKIGFNPEYLFEWPYLVEESAEFIVRKRVKAVGTDGLSMGGWEHEVPAHGPIAPRGSPAETHRILLREGIILVEALRNLDKVLEGQKTKRAFFVYAPISIRGAEGGPCRAMALMFE